MIDISKLTKDDVGKYVFYDVGHKKEYGRIKSWNETGIFVVFNCGGNWEHYYDYTAAHTNPNDLRFA